MSKNKNYDNYFKKPKVEEPVKDDREEIPAVEEEKVEEAPVEEEKVEEITPAEPIKVYAVVSGAKRVNMRSKPNTGSNVITVLSEGTKVELHDSVDKVWSSVSYNGRDGYMMTMYLRPLD